MLELFYSALATYGVMGGLVGVWVLDRRTRGNALWLRSGLGLILAGISGAAIAVVLATYSPDWGLRMLLRSAIGTWSGVWAGIGVLSLWRSNVAIAQSVDRWGAGAFFALSLSAAVAQGALQGVGEHGGPWVYAALPVLAGALYRLVLLILFLRLDDGGQAMARSIIESRLTGSVHRGERRGATAAFDPLRGTLGRMAALTKRRR